MTPMKELMAATLRTYVPKMVAEVLSPSPFLQTRTLSWRERLLSWPWRPWVRTKTEFKPQGSGTIRVKRYD